MYYTIQSWCYYKDGVGASELSLGLGLGIFCVGIVGNLWHHVLLAKLRKADGSAADALIRVEGESTAAVTDSTGKYKIPEGGLFRFVTCPHYLFEITTFWGIALVAMNLLPLTCAFNTMLFLSGQATATTRWYQEKFGAKWPKERKHIIPFVY
jgi:very-long-chain enoyl-CoA reductase